jgi:hypothetical protein
MPSPSFKPALAATMLLAAASLAGCAVPSAAERARLDALIGHPEVDLLRSYGVPTRNFTAQGHTFLAYDRSYTTVDPGFGPWGGFGPYGFGGYGGFGYGGFGGGFGAGFPPSVDTYSCVTTFEIDNDRVAAWTLHGDGC